MKQLKICLGFVFMLIAFNIASSQKVCAAADDPRVMLESYKITEGVLSAGEVVTASLTFKNTSSSKSVSSILITYSNSDGLVYPADGETNQIYIESIGAKKSVTKDITFVVAENANNWENIKVNFFISFSKEGGNKDSNELTALFSFSEKCSLNIVNYAITRENENSDNIDIVFYASNTGSIDMTNIVMYLVGDENAKTEIKVDDIGYNSSVSKEFTTGFVVPKDRLISVYFTYEDINGNKYQSDVGNYTVELARNLKDEKNESILDKLYESKIKLIIIAASVLGIVILWGIGKKKEK